MKLLPINISCLIYTTLMCVVLMQTGVEVRAQESDPATIEIDQLRRRLAELESAVNRLQETDPSPSSANNFQSRSVQPVNSELLPPSPSYFPEAGSLALSAAAGAAEPPPKPKFPTVQVNGVVQTDMGFFGQDENSRLTYGNIQDGVDFRRARLSAKGSLTETVNYFLQMDFAFFGRPTFTDLWVEQTKVPILGNVRVGQWKHPFSLEVVSSFRYTTFVERSLLFIPFTPFRHVGTGFYDHNEAETMTWAVSGFRTGQDQYGGSIANAGGWGTAERITFLPYWDDASKGESYLHLGMGHFFNTPPNHIHNFRTVPEMFIGGQAPGDVGSSGQPLPGKFNGTPFFVQTGNLGINHYNVIGTELLWVRGPLSIQSEAMVNFVDQSAGVYNGTPIPANRTVNFNNGFTNAILAGAYAQVGYFLTGEHRPYDRKTGTIDRIIPHRSFGPWRDDGISGWGAWEVAGRWSHLDLNDRNIRGGRITDFTAGVNWYLNPYWKMQFNYINSNPDYTVQEPPAGTPQSAFSRSTTHMYDLRCQFDF